MTTTTTADHPAPETTPDGSSLDLIRHAVAFAHYAVCEDTVWEAAWELLKDTPFAPEGADPEEVRAELHQEIDYAAFTVSPLGVAMTAALGQARMRAVGVTFPPGFGPGAVPDDDEDQPGRYNEGKAYL